MWTPSVIVMEPGASERIMSMPLRSATFPARDGNPAPGPQQLHPEPVVPSCPEQASAKGGTDAVAGGSGDARAPAARQATVNPGRPVAARSASDAANMVIMRRDTADTQQFSGFTGGASKPTPRHPSQDFRPAHTRAVA